MFDDLLALGIALGLLGCMALWILCLPLIDSKCRNLMERRRNGLVHKAAHADVHHNAQREKREQDGRATIT